MSCECIRQWVLLVNKNKTNWIPSRNVVDFTRFVLNLSEFWTPSCNIEYITLERQQFIWCIYLMLFNNYYYFWFLSSHCFIWVRYTRGRVKQTAKMIILCLQQVGYGRHVQRFIFDTYLWARSILMRKTSWVFLVIKLRVKFNILL